MWIVFKLVIDVAVVMRKEIPSTTTFMINIILLLGFLCKYMKRKKQADIINGEDMIVRMFQRIWEERAFFRNAFQDKSQNSLSEYILEVYIKQEIEVLCRYLRVESLEEEMEYTIKQYSYGCLGHTIEWIQGKNELSPEIWDITNIDKCLIF